VSRRVCVSDTIERIQRRASAALTLDGSKRHGAKEAGMNDWHNHVALVVEDSQLQREHRVGLLKLLKFGTILEACDGFDALRVLDARGSEAVDLVLTDLDMPIMDGIELIPF